MKLFAPIIFHCLLFFCFTLARPGTASLSWIKSVQSHVWHSLEKTCSRDLIQFDCFRSLEMKSSTFTGCQSYSGLLSFSGLVRHKCDLWGSTYGAPRYPLAGPTLAPDAAQHRGAAVISPDKSANALLLAPHESNQAHREHIRTFGFYLPFLWGLAKSRAGRQVCQVPRLWPPVYVERSLWASQKSSVLHSPDSCCRFSCSLLATEAYMSASNSWQECKQPRCNLKALSKKPSHVNAASQARE